MKKSFSFNIIPIYKIEQEKNLKSQRKLFNTILISKCPVNWKWNFEWKLHSQLKQVGQLSLGSWHRGERVTRSFNVTHQLNLKKVASNFKALYMVPTNKRLWGNKTRAGKSNLLFFYFHTIFGTFRLMQCSMFSDRMKNEFQLQ